MNQLDVLKDEKIAKVIELYNDLDNYPCNECEGSASTAEMILDILVGKSLTNLIHAKKNPNFMGRSWKISSRNPNYLYIIVERHGGMSSIYHHVPTNYDLTMPSKYKMDEEWWLARAKLERQL